MKHIKLGVAVVAALGAMALSTGASAAVVKIEAESFVAEGGGSAGKATDRPGASGGVAAIGLDAKDHWLEWKVDVPEAGDYQVVIRYAANRKWTVYRDLQINGKVADGFAKVALPPTGGWGRAASEWKNLTVAGADGKPLTIKLDKGTYTIRMNNLGGDGENGSANLDAIALVSAGEQPGF